jgi:hypothetical protein
MCFGQRGFDVSFLQSSAIFFADLLLAPAPQLSRPPRTTRPRPRRISCDLMDGNCSACRQNVTWDNGLCADCLKRGVKPQMTATRVPPQAGGGGGAGGAWHPHRRRAFARPSPRNGSAAGARCCAQLCAGGTGNHYHQGCQAEADEVAAVVAVHTLGGTVAAALDRQTCKVDRRRHPCK